ncbi:MAG: hypothetical protein NVS2B14_16880 [Chamaesiphon sp.]
MATYTLVEAPEVNVSVRGKDSPTTRQKAVDKIVELLDSGELPTQLPNGLSAEQLILVEVPPKNADLEDDEEDTLVMAVRELNKFSSLKLKHQHILQSALQARQNINILFTDEPIEQDIELLEEMLKGSFKILKEFAFFLVEYRKAKPGADEAKIILDEALQMNVSSLPTSNASDNLSTATEATTETTKNGKKKDELGTGNR